MIHNVTTHILMIHNVTTHILMNYNVTTHILMIYNLMIHNPQTLPSFPPHTQSRRQTATTATAWCT